MLMTSFPSSHNLLSALYHLFQHTHIPPLLNEVLNVLQGLVKHTFLHKVTHSNCRGTKTPLFWFQQQLLSSHSWSFFLTRLWSSQQQLIICPSLFLFFSTITHTQSSPTVDGLLPYMLSVCVFKFVKNSSLLMTSITSHSIFCVYVWELSSILLANFILYIQYYPLWSPCYTLNP